MHQVCVIGLGQFGMHLARRLVKMGCEVIALDDNEDRIAEIQDHVQQAMIGDARELDTLKAIITDDVSEVVVCVGESIEPSILCTLHLHQLGVKTIRVKATNEDHALILKAVGATEVFFPERDTAERTARRIAHPHLLDFFPFAEDFRIMEVTAPRAMVGKSIVNSGLRTEYDCLALAIRDAATGEHRFMPSADATIRERDVLIVLGREINLARLSAAE